MGSCHCWYCLGIYHAHIWVYSSTFSIQHGDCRSLPGECFFYILLFLTRRWWLVYLAGKGKIAAAAAGIFCALVVEVIAWVTQIMAGTTGNVTDPNFWLNLVLTMPWYIGLVIIFVRVQDRRRFSIPVVLLLGGLYKTLLIGVLNATTAYILMSTQVSFISNWAWLARAGFWQFIPIYSALVLIPAWILNTRPVEITPMNAKPIWLDAIRPAFWLLPYILYWFAYSILPVVMTAQQ